jgi:hypothetical protein
LSGSFYPILPAMRGVVGVEMDTSRMTTRLVGAALVALALLPASAQAAALTPLKPCYVSATQTARESIDLGGNGFTPGSLVDVSLNGAPERTLQADAAGNLPPQVLSSPFQAAGQGAFTLTAAERGNPANTISLSSRTTRLGLKLTPSFAKPSHRVRYKGSGFTEQRAVWAHYLYKGKVRKTVRLVRQVRNPCGLISVKRKQIPVKIKRLRRMTGRWRIQVDQQRRYSRAPRTVFVRIDVDVRVKR